MKCEIRLINRHSEQKFARLVFDTEVSEIIERAIEFVMGVSLYLSGMTRISFSVPAEVSDDSATEHNYDAMITLPDEVVMKRDDSVTLVRARRLSGSTSPTS